MLQRHAHCAWATTIIMLIIFVACDACWVCLCCHNPPNSDRDYSIFIVRTNVNACDCARGCTATERESALKVGSGKKIPCCTRESGLRQQRDGLMLLPTELQLIATWPHDDVSCWRQDFCTVLLSSIFVVCIFLSFCFLTLPKHDPPPFCTRQYIYACPWCWETWKLCN